MRDPPGSERSVHADPGASRVYAKIAAGSGVPVEGQRPEDRDDHVIWVPMDLLFQPGNDPTEAYPGESANVVGYFLAPDQTVTIAVTTESSAGLDLVDSAWNAFRRTGMGLRHLTVINDRGQVVSLITLQLGFSDDLRRLLRTLLVVPLRSKDGVSEVHLFATQEELATLAERIETGGPAPSHPYVASLPPARHTGPLQPEDWAFLGLLSAIGAFDGPEGPSPRLVAEALGVDASAFAEKAQAVERGMEGLVTGLFAPSGVAP